MGYKLNMLNLINKGEKMKIKEIKNFKMNDSVYKLRRSVINLIYEVKNEIKNLPRISVRIGEPRHQKTLGVAALKDNKIWITEDAINMGPDALRNVVFHEIVHAVTGFGHDDNCPLMQPTLKTILNKQDCLNTLKKYIN